MIMRLSEHWTSWLVFITITLQSPNHLTGRTISATQPVTHTAGARALGGYFVSSRSSGRALFTVASKAS